MKVFGVVNQKGGIGKTTLCFNLSTLLRDKGVKVFLIDLDPQASLTITLFKKVAEEEGSYELLTSGGNLKPVEVDGLALIPSSPSLQTLKASLYPV
ncbi:MAG: ParA family protein [Candidatus Kryptonium sp.]